MSFCHTVLRKPEGFGANPVESAHKFQPLCLQQDYRASFFVTSGNSRPVRSFPDQGLHLKMKNAEIQTAYRKNEGQLAIRLQSGQFLLSAF